MEQSGGVNILQLMCNFNPNTMSVDLKLPFGLGGISQDLPTTVSNTNSLGVRPVLPQRWLVPDIPGGAGGSLAIRARTRHALAGGADTHEQTAGRLKAMAQKPDTGSGVRPTDSYSPFIRLIVSEQLDLRPESGIANNPKVILWF